MKITKIAKMGKEDKFAVFVDDKLNMVINGEALLASGINIGQNLTQDELNSLNTSSQTNKLQTKALKYISIRIRSEGEMRQYLKRKAAKPEQITEIIKKLKNLDLINDQNYVRAYIHDRTLQTPSSKRKITYELRKKQIAEQVIEKSLQNEMISDLDSLKKMIVIKRRQPKFKDDLKLMQYLVRIGFNYSDVKQALQTEGKNNLD
jgi:regulatory protein